MFADVLNDSLNTEREANDRLKKTTQAAAPTSALPLRQQQQQQQRQQSQPQPLSQQPHQPQAPTLMSHNDPPHSIQSKPKRFFIGDEEDTDEDDEADTDDEDEDEEDNASRWYI